MSNFTELIANLSVAWITSFVILLTGLRFILIRNPGPSSRASAEIVESGLIAIVLVFLLIRPFVVQAYYIPSPSMEPTLLGKDGSGDRILVNKFQYRLPNHYGPKRQDVVVFLPPPEATSGRLETTSEAPINFIKRLIGLPGDKIQAVHGDVVIKGVALFHNVVRRKIVEANFLGAVNGIGNDIQADHHLKFTQAGVLWDGKLIPKEQLAQILSGDPHTEVKVEPGYVIRNGQHLNEPYTAEDPDYDLQIYHGQPLKWMPAIDESGDVYKLDGIHISREEYYHDKAQPAEVIPANHYFMMGDNRNDSEDSTEWGPLESKRVVGRAQFIFWPPSRIRAIH